MTIGLTWRRTARRIKRLKEGVLTISPDYSDRPTPDFLALSSLRNDAQVGVIAESVPKRTLRGIEECGARISQRPEPILERFGQPDVAAIEADVFPAKRGDVGDKPPCYWTVTGQGRMSPTKATRQTAPGRSMLYREI